MKNKTAFRTSIPALGKHLFAAAVVAISAFLASPASAACMSSGSLYCDTTSIKAYNGTSVNGYTGPGFSSSGSGIGDVLEDPGHGFNTDRLIATLTDHRGVTTLELKYYTTFNGNDEGARYADIFLGNNPSSPNTFGYAISVGDELANGGMNTTGFYNVSGANSTETSIDVWKTRTGYIYGGAFQGTDSVFRASPVVVTPNAVKNTSFATNVLLTGSGDTNFPYLVDVKLSASNTDFNALFGGGLSVFWGTGDCSNDAVEALIAYAPTHIPEPLTLSLFGTGMVGAVALRRRRKSRPAA